MDLKFVEENCSQADIKKVHIVIRPRLAQNVINLNIKTNH